MGNSATDYSHPPAGYPPKVGGCGHPPTPYSLLYLGGRRVVSGGVRVVSRLVVSVVIVMRVRVVSTAAGCCASARVPAPSTPTSTRRLRWRPAGVPLSATGC